MLGYGYWTRQFGKDPEILNKPVTVNGTSLTIVGVAQAGFSGVQIGRDTDMFIPMSMKALMTPDWDWHDRPQRRWLNIIGRLEAGIHGEERGSGNRADVSRDRGSGDSDSEDFAGKQVRRNGSWIAKSCWKRARMGVRFFSQTRKRRCSCC